MPHGRNKYQSRENRAKVRQALISEWDPIGVSEVPEAQDGSLSLAVEDDLGRTSPALQLSPDAKLFLPAGRTGDYDA